MRRLMLLATCLMAWPIALAARGTVVVLYAGSLVNVMEHAIGPAFTSTEGSAFTGVAAGSKALANELAAGLRRGDVFISADPAVDDRLMGAGNGNHLSWYVSFAHSPLVLGYNPASRVGAELRAGKPWYQVLAEPGIRIGRTDPKLDPKGALTLTLLDRAAAAYHEPGLAQAVLGPPDNPAQILPEETLIGYLQSGQRDVGFFYATETTALHIPAIALPPDLAPAAQYTATVPTDAPHPEAGARFVAFLLSRPGQAILRRNGLDIVPPALTGPPAAVPAAVRAALAR